MYSIFCANALYDATTFEVDNLKKTDVIGTENDFSMKWKNS